MTLTINANQQRFAPLNFNHMSYPSHPHFTNPWTSTSSASASSSTVTGATTNGSHSTSSASQQPQPHHSLFVGGQDGNTLPHLNLSGINKSHAHAQQQAAPRISSSSGHPYSSIPVTAAAAGSPHLADGVFGPQNLLPFSQDLLSLSNNTRLTQHGAASSATYAPPTSYAPPVSQPYTPASSAYEHIGYAPAARGAYSLAGHADHQRRYSHQSVASTISLSGDELDVLAPPRTSLSDFLCSPVPPNDNRKTFQDALEATHGFALAESTPRNIYDVRNQRHARGSADSYGFPSTHSTSSSVSSTGFSPYFGPMDAGSVSDYSTTGSDIESLSGRSLPRPQGLMPNQPPAPQSMMGQFSAKVASSTQKKHKCKVCDKRFTRPSSLQTHMYSHTGEKPFKCDVEGCGRHFSVVSNLRRHKKVHKGGQMDDSSPSSQAETPSEAGSEDLDPNSD